MACQRPLGAAVPGSVHHADQRHIGGAGQSHAGRLPVLLSDYFAFGRAGCRMASSKYTTVETANSMTTTS